MKKERICAFLFQIFFIILTVLFVFYCSGVIEKNKFLGRLQEYNTTASQYINLTNSVDDEDVINNLTSEYSLKTRTVSLVLKNSSNILNESALEELRLAIGADIISISDTEGNICASTSLYEDGKTIRDNFASHISDTVYTDSIIVQENESYKVVSATVRPDNQGFIQITYSADDLVYSLGTSNIYQYMEDIKINTEVMTCLVSKEDMKYVICSEQNFENTSCSFDLEKMDSDGGKFSEEFQGEKYYMYYSTISLEDKSDCVLITAVPYRVMYSTRNSIVKWAALAVVIISFIMFLNFRNIYLKINPEKSENDG